MAANNPILYNAALQGAYAAAGAGSSPIGGSQAAAGNAEILAAAEAIATAVDAAIPADATITTGGATTAPTTGAIANAQLSKSSALGNIVFASFQGQAFDVVPSGAALSAVVAGIVAKYDALIAALNAL